MKKFTLYLGLNDKDTKVQEINTIEAYKIVTNLVTEYFGGGTIFEANGIYKHDDGTIVTEKTLRIELMFTDKNTIIEFISILKKVFNQESIILQEQNIESELL